MGAAEFIGVYSTKAVPAAAAKPAQRKLFWFVWNNEDAGKYYAQQLNAAFQGVGTPRALPQNLFERAFSYEPTLLVMPISKLLPTEVESKVAKQGAAGQMPKMPAPQREPQERSGQQAGQKQAAGPTVPGQAMPGQAMQGQAMPGSQRQNAGQAEAGKKAHLAPHENAKDILNSVLSSMNEEERAAVYPRSGQKITVATFPSSPDQATKPALTPEARNSQGVSQEALDAFQQASHWEKDMPVALDDVAVTKSHKPLASKSISAAERLDMNLRQEFELCMVNLRAGKKREAVGKLERLLGTSDGIIPAHKHAFTEFGCNLRKSNMYLLAEQFFTKALELAPDDANAHFNLAKSYTKLNKYEDANRLLEMALAMDPQLNCAKALLKEVRPRLAKIRL